jgi:N-acyl-D-amino-acid deacylase
MMLNYLVSNARIVDPESGLDFEGSVGIQEDKIAGLYPASAPLPPAKETIDAGGGILIPGFIDIHAHSDNDIPCAEKLLAMGVTTAVSGNCGISPVNFEAFFAEFEKTGYPINQLELAGHSSLREAAGQKDALAPANKSQIETMKQLAREAYAAGAAGISFGLEYVPGTPPDEVLELARTAAEAGLFIAIHGRWKSPDDLESLREALEISVLTGAPLIYSHLVYMYRGTALREALRVIEAYRANNANVWVDSGMYTSFASFAGAVIFAEELFERHKLEYGNLRAASGKYAGQILDREKYLEMRRHFPLDCFIYDGGESSDVYTAYSLRDVMVSTDCMKFPAGQGHPQGAATYPLFFRVMVKERKQLTLMDAVKRCTLIPARAAGLAGKGRLKSGMDADIVVLDWERLREHADFPGMGDPGAPPEGITHVFVNGTLSVTNGKRFSGVYAGRAIRSA